MLAKVRVDLKLFVLDSRITLNNPKMISRREHCRSLLRVEPECWNKSFSILIFCGMDSNIKLTITLLSRY